MALTLTGGSSHAEPAMSTADARRELAALNEAVDIAVEDYASTRLELAAAQRRVDAAAARVRRQQERLAAAQAGLSGLIGAIYVSGGTNQLMSLVTSSSPTEFLDRATTLDTVARNRSAQVRLARVLRQRVDAERTRADEALRAAHRVADRARQARVAIEAQVARQERLVDRLESAQARRERQAREARAAQQARRERLARATREARPAAAAPATYAGSAAGRAEIAVRAAYAQLGKPYKWGAAGPDRFDCSGLTMYVWAKAGVSLPHSSRAQRNAGRTVSRAELRPGDLIFRGRPTIHHVGIYIGDGRMISAPQTGDVVKISNAFAGEYAGAVRL